MSPISEKHRRLIEKYSGRRIEPETTDDTPPKRSPEPLPEAEAAATPASAPYSIHKVRVGGRLHEIMLDVHASNGLRYALPYAGLIAAIYDPGEGVALHFSSHVIRIEGGGLEPLYAALKLHHVQWVREGDDGRTEIEKVDIEER